MSRDPHIALKTEVVAQTRGQGLEVALARLQWSKDDVGFSLHVAPNTFSTAGLQLTDFLSYLGFQHSGCSFHAGRQCYWAWAPNEVDAAKFTADLGEAFGSLQSAQRDLEACGFFLDQPEGWGFFLGSGRSDRSNRIPEMSGDGHSAATRNFMKESEDAVFQFKFVWLETGNEKGWVIHYRPKHPPLSSELEGTFRFLKIHSFGGCPEFDFDPCYWRSIAFSSRGDGFFDSNAQAAHSWFAAHAARFSPGIENLLATNSIMEAHGFVFLPGLSKPIERINVDVAKRTFQPKVSEAKGTARGSSTVKGVSGNFDVAISFAGPEREQAEQLATAIRDAGYSVFYDDFYPEELWGKNLVDTFQEIYQKRARFCVMFISKDYKERAWTNHERQSAQARAISQVGTEYILPIRVDETELPGMPTTVGYVPISKGIDTIAKLLLKKLGS